MYPLKWFFIGFLVILLEGCDTSIPRRLLNTQEKTSSGQIHMSDPFLRIGVLTPKTGQHKVLGQSLWHAVLLAYSAHGSEKMSVTHYDTKSTLEGLSQALRQAHDDDVHYFLGPIFTRECQHLAMIRDKKDVFLTLSSQNPSLKAHLITLGFQISDQLDPFVAFCKEHPHLGITASFPKTSLGQKMTQVFKDLVPTSLAPSVKIEAIDDAYGQDFIPPSKNPLLFLGHTLKETKQVMSTLLYHEVDVDDMLLFGTSFWEELDHVREPSLFGAYFWAPERKRRKIFEETFKKTYGYYPKRLSTLIYDGFLLLCHLHKASFLKENQPSDIQGLDGPFFLDSAHRVRRRLILYQYTPRGLLEKKSAHIKVPRRL